ncbi:MULTISPECIES: hypothetical protein [Actinomadura]|uniref:hypothetical protein n=1 Tax=Actinomadura TaxID=1988 RepID=UPI0003F85BEA|nr:MULTISPECIES: hypothetical protein [Actinomadura]RSN62428.1 hypothetical protein DMH08_19265 [Actinomadura sp. WAC 06369]
MSLPTGWTLERVRAVSGCARAAVLTAEAAAALDVREVDGRAEAPVAPHTIDLVLTFDGLCLVRAEGEWLMGGVDDDGSVLCWASYGDDLYEALRGL